MPNPHTRTGAHQGGSLTALALRRPVTVMMLCLSMLLLGIGATKLLPLEKFPGIEIPEMVVQASYEASTPAEVERLITKPLEEAISTMGGIKRLNSNSSESGSEIYLEMKWDANIGGKSIEVREKVDAVRHLLPDDLQRVFVYQFSTGDLPILNLRLSSERDLQGAYQLLDKMLKRPIERIAGVSKVDLYGVDPRAITIRLDSDRLAAHHVDVNALLATLRQYNFSMSAGEVLTSAGKIRVTPQGEFTSLSQIQQLPVGDNLRLDDIAEIRYELPEREEGRHLDQRYAVGLDVFKESSANLVEVARRVTEVVNAVADDPQFNGINLFMMEDQAQGVKDSLADLLAAGGIGALLSFVVLYLFLRNITTTMVVVASVPFSICITLAVMYLLGYSLNILSMMGLLLAVGMLVDNSVVVTESVLQEQTRGKSGEDAVLSGVNKVGLAVITGTLTTMIVFLPNIVGEKMQLTVFLEHVAIAICISLAASLLIAKTLLPLLISKLNINLNKGKSADDSFSTNAFSRRYDKSLGWVLAHPKTTGLAALLILASTALPMGVITADNDDNDDNSRLRIFYHFDAQYPVEQVEAEVDRMEAYLYANKEAFFIDSVYSYYRPGHAVSTLLLNDERSLTMARLKEKIRENMPKFATASPEFGWRSSKAGGVDITLTGPSTDMLMQLAEQVVPILKHVDGLVDVRSETADNQQEMVLVIDREAASRLGLTTRDVAAQVGAALRGVNLRSFRHDPSGEIDIRLVFDEEIKHSLDRLKRVPIAEKDGQIITLDSVATFRTQPRLSQISRQNRQTALSIGAGLNDITMEQARDRIKAALANVQLPSGYDWRLGGGFQRQDESQQVMVTNMLLAVAMIYIVMAALFESLLLPTAIISSIIYSIVGVFWFFLLTGTNLSVMGMIGILILMGIVVNNGIVLVDQINQRKADLSELPDIIRQACVSRLRPVLMTVGTTVLGMVPLALGSTQIGGDGPSYSPLAIAIIGGLTFSTLTSLYLVPYCYLMLTKLAQRSSDGVYRANAFAGRWVKPRA